MEKPQNVDDVEAKGLDIQLKQTYILQRLKFSVLLNYAFTQTFVLEGFTEMTPFKGRQMPLLPEHTAMGLFQVDYKRFFAAVNAHYVGDRTTSNVFESMHAYVLFNCSAGYKLEAKKKSAISFFRLRDIIYGRYLSNRSLQSNALCKSECSVYSIHFKKEKIMPQNTDEKKSLYLFFLVSAIIGCHTDEPTPTEKNYDYTCVLVNMGNYSESNGSVALYNEHTGIVEQEVYTKANARKLGAIIDSALLHNDLLLLMCNNSA